MRYKPDACKGSARFLFDASRYDFCCSDRAGVKLSQQANKPATPTQTVERICSDFNVETLPAISKQAAELITEKWKNMKDKVIMCKRPDNGKLKNSVLKILKSHNTKTEKIVIKLSIFLHNSLPYDVRDDQPNNRLTSSYSLNFMQEFGSYMHKIPTILHSVQLFRL